MSLLLSSISKSFRQGEQQIQVLKGLNAEVKTGETVAIVGRSGSGKSTLLALMAGLEKPDQGDILIQNQKINLLNENQMTLFRAQNMAFVFQQYHLISHLTAAENVHLPLQIMGRQEDISRSESLLQELGLGHRLHHFPSQMSGGECQRVAIARALITEPKILFADEPSGNLDSETGDQVMDLFFNLVSSKKITTVLVTHSESLAKRCQRRLLLSQGLLQEQKS